MTDERFCTECGGRLGPEDSFCPACGAEVKKLDEVQPADTQEARAETQATAVRKGSCGGSNSLQKVMLLTLIWAVIGVAFGAMFLFDSGSLTDNVIDAFKNMKYDDTRTYWDYLLQNGYDRSYLLSTYTTIGATFLLSGIFGFLSAFFQYKAEHYMFAFVCLLLCAVLAISGIITLIIGIIVLYYLTKCKDTFKS